MGLPSQGFKDLLVAAGFTFGGSADWAIYIGVKPIAPLRVIVITDSGGNTPDPRWLLDYPKVQVSVSGSASDYQACMLKCQQIKQILLGLPSQDLNGDRWVSVLMAGDFAFVGFDTNRQPEFVGNFSLIIEPAQAATDNRDPL